MIYPTPDEILRCVDETLRDSAEDDVSRTSIKSALATSRHLVRHVALRVKEERTILFDDIDKATQLLGNLASYLDTGDSDHGGLMNNIRTELASSLQVLSCASSETEIIRLRAKTLRELIYVTLKHLQAVNAQEKTTAAYLDARRLLREYMTYQIQQESRLIYPAFAGKGPRR